LELKTGVLWWIIVRTLINSLASINYGKISAVITGVGIAMAG